MPRITRNMTVRSPSLPRARAVNEPNNTPPTVATMIASTPSRADTGKWSRMMSLTERFCWVKEIPKSPFSMLPRNIPYWTMTGLSRPYLCSRLARISGRMALLPEMGSPGTRCMATNVAVAMK
jgi:hypothetical protein